jgi:hypothetical protein
MTQNPDCIECEEPTQEECEFCCAPVCQDCSDIHEENCDLFE